jgi:hypothetical protein
MVELKLAVIDQYSVGDITNMRDMIFLEPAMIFLCFVAEPRPDLQQILSNEYTGETSVEKFQGVAIGH